MAYRVEELSIPGGIFTIFREELHFFRRECRKSYRGGGTMNSGGNFQYFPGGIFLFFRGEFWRWDKGS